VSPGPHAPLAAAGVDFLPDLSAAPPASVCWSLIIMQFPEQCRDNEKLDGTRRAAVDDYASACCDLDLWPENLISIAPGSFVRMWSNSGGKLAPIVTKILYSPDLSSDYLLWPWPFIPKSHQYTCEPKCICDRNWLRFPSLLLRYSVHKVFDGTHRLIHGWT